ncbi:hypothetical protein HMN09_00982700 [Mycena chlorophos]|uniref:F-box domain-containing protein n=1 Tax=Mycena chlorophos TaxID=658473 RepID=A0A8H6SIU4_MYCCL|nr:hypothetical protein HMN09_00982700 [Mycena chlorophos]
MTAALESSFSTLLNTNYCPNDAEIAEIRSLLESPRIRLRELEDNIRQFQTQRDELVAHIATHEALLSPIRRVPVDILQEIFLACLPEGRNCVMSANDAPLLLGRVCSHWRTLAYQTPALWTRLHIVQPGGLYSPSLEAKYQAISLLRLSAAKDWLERSGQLPLSLSFSAAYGYVLNFAISVWS